MKLSSWPIQRLPRDILAGDLHCQQSSVARVLNPLDFLLGIGNCVAPLDTGGNGGNLRVEVSIRERGVDEAGFSGACSALQKVSNTQLYLSPEMPPKEANRFLVRELM